MHHQIVAEFLEKFPILTEEERKGIAEVLMVKSYKKGTIIQEEDKIPKHCFFVLSGCIRQYQIMEGIEKTTEFYTDSHAAISSECYTQKIPSDFFLECMEDSVLMVGEHGHDAKVIEAFPVLQTIMMQIAEEEWVKTRKSLSSFKLLSPENRYIDFLEHRKDLINRVPNHQIASYLGITPESLSRLRKRILIKEKNNS